MPKSERNTERSRRTEPLTADLERDGERVQKAVLLSPTQQYVYVYDRGTSDVYFSFGVDGDLIDLQHGSLRIGITIEQGDESDSGIVITPRPPDSDAGVCLGC